MNEGAVRGAVDEFAKNHSLLVFKTAEDYSTWIFSPNNISTHKTVF